MSEATSSLRARAPAGVGLDRTRAARAYAARLARRALEVHDVREARQPRAQGLRHGARSASLATRHTTESESRGCTPTPCRAAPRTWGRSWRRVRSRRATPPPTRGDCWRSRRRHRRGRRPRLASPARNWSTSASNSRNVIHSKLPSRGTPRNGRSAYSCAALCSTSTRLVNLERPFWITKGISNLTSQASQTDGWAHCIEAPGQFNRGGYSARFRWPFVHLRLTTRSQR